MTRPPESDPDVLVVGAGPAGSAAAITCARAGLRVLIVERSTFPRPKVCGCCLDPTALAALGRLGATAALDGWWQRLERARIDAWGRTATLPIRGRVLSRDRLDAELLGVARAEGVRVLSPARARLAPADGERRRVRIEGDGVVGGAADLTARLVVVACGLAGLDRVGGSRPDRLRSVRRIGVGAVAPADALSLAAGTVRMAAGSAGYLGAVRLEDGRIDLAASVRVAALADGGPGSAVARILTEAGASPLPSGLEWRGTPILRRVAGRRPRGVVAVGDAAGFWEPFTGEGIGWALESGERLRPLARRLASGRSVDPTPSGALGGRVWMLRRQAHSRAVAWMVAGRWRARLALALAEQVPTLGRWASGRVATAGEAAS